MTIDPMLLADTIAGINSLVPGHKMNVLHRLNLPPYALDADIANALNEFGGIPPWIPAPVLDQSVPATKARMLKKIDWLYLAKTTDVGATCPTTFGVAQCDDAYPLNSRSLITGIVVMAGIATDASQAFSQAWRMNDNTIVTMNAAQMISFGVQVGQYVDACFAHKSALKDQVNAAKTPAALAAIDVTAGWPATS